MSQPEVMIIGGGLAGSEAAYFLLRHGISVKLYERRPLVDDHAHTTDRLGELVCSNSLKSKQLSNACGLLKEEMRQMDSLTMKAAAIAEVPGGNALSVDRDVFADYITKTLTSFPHFQIIRKEITELPTGKAILATGPLTSESLLEQLGKVVGQKNLSFFDASAPIIAKDSVDFSKAYFKSRFEQGDSAYLNCPFTREEYNAFITALVTAEKALVHDFDTHYFEGCLPIEVMASRGLETLRHGPLKPFGLSTEEHPHPYAVAQLRQDTKLGDYYNLVGFQTNLTYPEQQRVFRMIPGLEHARFLRYGLMHRNSYIDAPVALQENLTLRNMPNLYIAGQLSGVEGYVESAAMGILAAIACWRDLENRPFIPIPKETVAGALVDYLLHADGTYFAPMNASWALFPASKKENRDATIQLALDKIKTYWNLVHE